MQGKWDGSGTDQTDKAVAQYIKGNTHPEYPGTDTERDTKNTYSTCFKEDALAKLAFCSTDG